MKGKAEMTEGSPDIDRGKAWLPVVGLWMASLMYGASTRSFGVLYEAIRNVYDSSETATSVIGALNIFLVGASAPFVAWLAGRLGYRCVAIFGAILTILGFASSSLAGDVTMWYLTYGVVLGLGISMAMLPGYLVVNMSFLKLKSLAVALGGSGGLFAAFIFPQIFTALIQSVNLVGCLLVMALISVPLLLNGLLYRLPGEPICGKLKISRCCEDHDVDPRRPSAASNTDLINHNDSQKHYDVIKSLLTEENISANGSHVLVSDSESVEQSDDYQTKNSKCSCLPILRDFAALSFLLIYLGMHSMAGFLSQFTVSFFAERGMTEEEGANIMAVGGLGGIVIALVSAAFMDLPVCRPYRADIANLLLMSGGAMMTFTPGVAGYSAQMALAFFRDGVTSVLHVQGVTVSHAVVGAQRTAELFGVATFVSAFGGLSGRLLGGLFYDNTGSYDGAFYTIGLLVVCSAVIFQLALVIKRMKNCNQEYETLK